MLIAPLLLISALFFGCVEKEVEISKPEKVFIETNPNVELVSIVYSMTTFEWLKMPEYAAHDYWKDVKKNFESYRRHSAVKDAQKLVNSYFAWDAPYALILHHSQPPELKKVENYSPYLLMRIKESGVEREVKDFLKDLRKFAKETNFTEFYAEHLQLYNDSIKRVREKTNIENLVNWLEYFYGMNASQYHIVLAHSLYGPRHTFGVYVDSKVYVIVPVQDFYGGKSIFVKNTDVFNLSILWIASYYFIDRCIEKNQEDFYNLSYLYAEKGQWLKKLRNSYILAFLAYSIEKNSGFNYAESFLKSKMGDLYIIPKIWEMYREYDSNRDKYPDFCSFFPKTIKALRETYPPKHSERILNKTACSTKIPENVEVTVDPRVELVEIIYRLSNSEWYLKEVAPEKLGIMPSKYGYLRDVDEYFGKYRNHEAISLARQMVKSGLEYEAIPKFAIHLSSKTFEKDRDWDDIIKERPELSKEELDNFASAAKKFFEDTNFRHFYESHKSYYDRLIENFKMGEDIGKIVEFEENFFGEKVKKWHIILQPTFACHNFGGWLETENGKEVYAFLGICGYDIQPKFCDVLVHEFAHSFVNPVVNKNYNKLFKKYEYLFEFVEGNMTRMAYSNFRIFLIETLVRAFEAYYLEENFGESIAYEKIAKEKERGFYFIDKIYEAYTNEYIANRSKYKSFEEFMPIVAKILEGVGYR